MVSCSRCSSTNIEKDGSSMVCTDCGNVVEDNNIVSEVSFVEGSNGAFSVVGQFVSASGKSFRSRGPRAYSRESREATLENGKKKIQHLASSMRISNQLVERAHRLYILAVTHNFVQGRRSQNVIASCLYTVCRRERTPHMLIDFSEALQTNVFVLGHTFLRFCTSLNLQLPIIDPCLYIPRFAARLEFEDKTQAVVNSAIKIVQRMKRDWIHTGRRPSGVCGAGLLIAARLHGFKRDIKEIVQIVRVCDTTLRRRLHEFAITPSGEMSVEDFETVDLEEEADPPCYTKNKIDEKKKAQKRKLTDETSENSENQTEGNKPDTEVEVVLPPASSVDELRREMENTLGEIENIQNLESFKFNNMDKTEQRLYGEIKEDHVSYDEEGELSLSDFDDEDIDMYISSETEVQMKTELWTELNKEYLDLMAQKEKDEASRPPNFKKPRKKREKKDGTSQPPGTPAEATHQVLKKKVSSKINYSALEGLFNVDKSIFDPKGVSSQSAGFGKGFTEEEEEEEDSTSEVDISSSSSSNRFGFGIGRAY